MRPGAVWPIAVLSTAVAAGASGSPVNLASCPETISISDPERQRAYAEFKRSIEGSPFARHLGRRVSCEVRADDGSIRLTYKSPTGAKLDALRDSTIELTEQRLNERGLAGKAAMTLLQRTETWAFGDKGCSIAWQNSPDRLAGPTPGSNELVYRGENCNCQARLVYSGDRLTGLVFRSAC